MTLNTERKRQVADMRAQTRAYLIDIRARRRENREPNPPAEPDEPAFAPEAPPAPAPQGLLPHPEIAALRSAEPRPVLKSLPLGALSLLGQGMIWRLNQLGIHSLDDLAACDPVKLGQKLGPIGRLLRTDVWIEAARQVLSAAE